MNKKDLKLPAENPVRLFDICFFRVPVRIQETTVENEMIKEAFFEEVPMENLCYKIEKMEAIDREDAINQAKKVAEKNLRTLKIASKTKKTGDLIIRMTITDHGKVKINTNINN